MFEKLKNEIKPKGLETQHQEIGRLVMEVYRIMAILDELELQNGTGYEQSQYSDQLQRVNQELVNKQFQFYQQVEKN